MEEARLLCVSCPIAGCEELIICSQVDQACPTQALYKKTVMHSSIKMHLCIILLWTTRPRPWEIAKAQEARLSAAYLSSENLVAVADVLES